MSKPVYLKVMFSVKPQDSAELEQAMLQCVAGSRKEDACIEYLFFRDLDQEGRYFNQEIWASQEGLDAHQETPYFKHFAATLKKLGGELFIASATPLEPQS